MLRFSDVSIIKKLILIMAIMAILITTELVSLCFTIKIFSAVRSYVGGEGLWSKAQKDAAYYLIKYSYTHNEKDYQYYRDFLKVPMSDHQARLALSKVPTDYKGAKQGFLGGRVHPDDIDGIIWLFGTFNRIYYIDKAIKVWTQADELMIQFLQLGDQLHLSISTNQATLTDIEKQLVRIDELNRELTTVEDEFSYTLGQASRWLENVIFKLLISIAITVEFTGIILTILTGIEISRNINAMNKVAKKVTKSDFSERVIVSSNDEIGQLALSFNTMIDELEKKIKRERQLENKFRSILEGAPDAMVITNQGGEMVMINAQTEKIFGYTRSEVIGKHFYYLVPEADLRKHDVHDKENVVNLSARESGPRAELYGRKKNGNEFPVEISVSPVETEEGILTLSAIRDITDKKNIENMLIDKNIQLENANLAKDQFLSHMSHELRTPLNGIITMTQLLGTSDLLKEQKDQLDIITESEERLLFVINQVLDFSKIKSGAIEVEKEMFDLRELIKKNLAIYEIKAKIRNIPFGVAP
jgi:PAS domain S-box-containing protein